jgi:hypothetical protein
VKVFIFILIFLLGELLAFFIFKGIRHRFERASQKDAASRRLATSNAILKGWLERFFIFLCLINELPHALTVLGALKIGTRLDADKHHPVSNDYFLIGNITSILVGIGYFLIWNKWQDPIGEYLFSF